MWQVVEFGAVALVVGVAAASCGNSEHPASGGGSGAGGSTGGGGGTADSSTSLGGGGSVGGSGGSGSSGGVAGSGGAWQPPGDPGWQPVTWQPAGCDFEYATNLANAAPPLIWEDCGPGTGGCQRLVPVWAKKYPPGYDLAFQGPPQLFKNGTTLRFSLHYYFREGDGQLDYRKAIYDENSVVLAAWRVKECGGNLLQWTTKHVCLAIGNGSDDTVQAILNQNDLTGPPLAVYTSGPTIPLACTDDLFASGLGSVQRLRDLVSGQELAIPAPSGGVAMLDPRLTGEYALFQRVAGVVDGWIWKRPNSVEQLVDPGAEQIYDIRSDGQTLVWIQAKSTDFQERAVGDLWTSTFATTMGALQPQKRRAVPATSVVASMKGVGGGWYALVEQPVGSQARFLHVYRLADAHHWQVPTPADVQPTDVIHVDGDEVWFTGMSINAAYVTVIRQQLSALGPGD